MEQHKTIRKHFELHMEQGTRPVIYSLRRLVGGEYVSPYTETAWKFYKDGWLKALGATFE